MLRKLKKLIGSKKNEKTGVPAIVATTLETFIHDKWEKSVGIDIPRFSTIENVVHHQSFLILIILQEYSLANDVVKVDISCNIENDKGEIKAKNIYNYSLVEKVAEEESFLLPSELPSFNFNKSYEKGAYFLVINLINQNTSSTHTIRKKIELIQHPELTVKVDLDSLNAWMQAYYLEPKPLELLHYFKNSLQLIPEENEIAMQLNLIFFIEAINQSPFLLKVAIDKINSLDINLQYRNGLLILIAHTYLTEEYLSTILSEKDLKAIQYIREKDYQNPVDSEDIEHTIELDFLWCTFFATGQYKYVAKILSLLEYRKYDHEPNFDQVKSAIYKAALWSISSNCKVHRWVEIYCIYYLKNEPLSHETREDLKQLLKQS